MRRGGGGGGGGNRGEELKSICIHFACQKIFTKNLNIHPFPIF